jgi:aminoglycoside phosphotransferase (APT) family kinase protein
VTSELTQRLEAHLTREIGARAIVHAASPLGGGACQDNYEIDAELPAEAGEIAGRRRLVLRADAKRSLPGSIDRRAEFAVVNAAADAGVKTPRARFLGEGLTRPGAFGYLLDWADGVAIGRRVVRDGDLAGARAKLPNELATELARIHSVTPESTGAPPLALPADRDPVRAALDASWKAVLALPEARPGLALALAWAERHPPKDRGLVLVHGDFRTGNFLVTPDGLSAVLDWEFSRWGARAEDIAWLCMRTWRFGETKKPVGGFGQRAELLDAYERASGHLVDAADVHFWEILGNVRWATGSIEQGERFLSSAERDLELVAIPRRAVEMEYEALRLVETGPR